MALAHFPELPLILGSRGFPLLFECLPLGVEALPGRRKVSLQHLDNLLELNLGVAQPLLYLQLGGLHLAPVLLCLLAELPLLLLRHCLLHFGQVVLGFSLERGNLIEELLDLLAQLRL